MAANERFILDFVTRGLEGIDKASDKITALNRNVNGLSSALLGVSFAAFVKGAFTAADSISDFSDATNISIGSLQAFGAAMNAAGGNSKNLEKSINTFFAAIENANTGSLAARDAFAKVGVGLQDLKNLSEADILQKTVEGLAKLPPGAERSAVAATLLSKAFRSVDAAEFLKALDPQLYAENEAAIKTAAETTQKLEKAFKDLQIAAINALTPLAKSLGEVELNAAAAEKIIKIVGITLAGAFALQVVTNVIAVGKAILALNSALKINAAIQAGIVALQGPKGLLILGAAAVATAGAVIGLDKVLENMADNKAAENHLKNLAEEAAETAKKVSAVTSGGKLTSAKPQAGAAGRNQELDARQKAVLESEKRIAESAAEIRRLAAIQGATEIEKIEADRVASIEKTATDIRAKTDLSKIQKEKEIAQKTLEINAKAANDVAQVRLQQEQTVNQQKQGFAQANLQLLGIEQTEVQKVTDLIAQQPLAYKEIGKAMLANAAIQDTEKKRIQEIVRQRQAEREEFGLMTQDMKAGIELENKMKEAQATALGTNKLNLTILQAEGEERVKLYDLENNIKGALESKLIALGRIDELNTKQIEDAATYNGQLAQRKGIIENEKNAKIALAEQDKRLAEDFATGFEGAFNRYVESSKNAAEQASGYFNTFTKGFEDAFANMFAKGDVSFKNLKNGFKDVANSIIADFVRIQAKQALLGIFGGGGGGGFLSSLFGGFFANGGTPPMGKVSVVGEQGPELFVPRTAGTIIPNGAMGGGTVNNTAVTYSIQAVDASSFKALLARDPEFIHNVAEQGRRQLPIRSRR